MLRLNMGATYDRDGATEAGIGHSWLLPRFSTCKCASCLPSVTTCADSRRRVSVARGLQLLLLPLCSTYVVPAPQQVAAHVQLLDVWGVRAHPVSIDGANHGVFERDRLVPKQPLLVAVHKAPQRRVR